jgi:hypothetical protein
VIQNLFRSDPGKASQQDHLPGVGIVHKCHVSHSKTDQTLCHP